MAILLCNLIWSILPLYWMLLNNLPPEQVVCHRITWSFLLTGLFLLPKKNRANAIQLFHKPKTILALGFTSAIISINWVVYVYLVHSGRVLEASLSTFISPLLTILLGIAILGNRPTRLQLPAMFLAAVGVMVQVKILGGVPFASLYMACAISLYGILRAKLSAPPIAGMFVENLLALPITIGFMLWWNSQGTLVFLQGDILQDLLAMGTGVVTAIPMCLMVYAMQNSSMITVGIMQFISPSIIFLLGIFVFKEQFTTLHLYSFALIWLGIMLYCADVIRLHLQTIKFLDLSKK